MPPALPVADPASGLPIWDCTTGTPTSCCPVSGDLYIQVFPCLADGSPPTYMLASLAAGLQAGAYGSFDSPCLYVDQDQTPITAAELPAGAQIITSPGDYAGPDCCSCSECSQTTVNFPCGASDVFTPPAPATCCGGLYPTLVGCGGSYNVTVTVFNTAEGCGEGGCTLGHSTVTYTYMGGSTWDSASQTCQGYGTLTIHSVAVTHCPENTDDTTTVRDYPWGQNMCNPGPYVGVTAGTISCSSQSSTGSVNTTGVQPQPCGSITTTIAGSATYFETYSNDCGSATPSDIGARGLPPASPLVSAAAGSAVANALANFATNVKAGMAPEAVTAALKADLAAARANATVSVTPETWAAVARDAWPAWANTVALNASPADKGVGDTIERTIGPVGGNLFKKAFKTLTGRPCGCVHRQDKYNAMYPYGM